MAANLGVIIHVVPWTRGLPWAGCLPWPPCAGLVAPGVGRSARGTPVLTWEEVELPAVTALYGHFPPGAPLDIVVRHRPSQKRPLGSSERKEPQWPSNVLCSIFCPHSKWKVCLPVGGVNLPQRCCLPSQSHGPTESEADEPSAPVRSQKHWTEICKTPVPSGTGAVAPAGQEKHLSHPFYL